MPTIIIIQNTIPSAKKSIKLDLTKVTCDTTRLTCDNDKLLIVNLTPSSIRQEFMSLNQMFDELYSTLAPGLLVPRTTDSIITADSNAIIF